MRKSPFSSEKNERAFLFSFAHLAQKTCHTGKCREETVSRIGKLLYDKFNKAKTYEEQVTAMYAMKNFGHGATLERLIAQTKPNVDRSIRLHALSAIMPLANTNRDRVSCYLFHDRTKQILNVSLGKIQLWLYLVVVDNVGISLVFRQLKTVQLTKRYIFSFSYLLHI